MESKIETIGALLLIAAFVAILARKLRLPYTAGLVVAGIIIKISPIELDMQLTKQLIFTLFLPPLIFEAALYLPWRPLRRDFPLIMTLATLGVAISAGLTSAGMHYIVGWSWIASALFGVLIAATDPVSVIATFKEAGVQGRLRLLVEGESLFNDGTAAVMLGVALAAANGRTLAPADIAQMFIVTILGGAVCGALVAGALLLLAGRTEDHLIEISFTMIAAYGSFLLAEHFHLSGVLATLTAGLIFGNSRSSGAISKRGRVAVEEFWDYIAFVVNSLIFLLIGIHTAGENFAGNLRPAAIAILLVFMGRALAVYPSCFLFSRSRLQVETGFQHILFWSGLRGALALALALGIPATVHERDVIRTVAFAVVGFSVLVQGLTIQPLLRKMKLITTSGEGKPLRERLEHAE